MKRKIILNLAISLDGYIIPIEVKAAEHVRAKSLQQYIKKYQPKYAIRVSGKTLVLKMELNQLQFMQPF